MHDPSTPVLARYRAPHPVDLGDRSDAHQEEANDKTVTVVDIIAELGRTEAADACEVSIDTIKRRLRAGAFPNARPPRRIALTQDSVTRRKRKASGDVRRRQRARRSCLRLGVKQFVMPLWRSSGGAD